MGIERQLRYFKYSTSSEEEHFYNLLMINTPEEIKKIKGRIRSQVVQRHKMIIEERKIDSQPIKRSGGLHFLLVTILSSDPNINLSRAYGGRIIRDRELSPKKDSSGWSYLIDKVARGAI